MNRLSPCAIILSVACTVCCPVRSAEQSIKLVVTEGRSIGFPTVADALSTLESRGLTPTAGLNGNVSFVEPNGTTAWTFAGKDDPAYPSAVRYVYTRSNGVLNAEVSILCEASAGQCEKYRSDIRDNLAQLSRKMAGDTSAKCSVNGDAMKCGAGAERQQPGQQIYAQVADDGTCTLDRIPTSCPDLGRKIRAEHPSDDPKVSICASARADPDLVGNVLSVIRANNLSPVFGCPPLAR